MSDFDLKLDRWSKISTIAIGLLGVVFSGYFFLFYEKPSHNIQIDSQCLDWLADADEAAKNGSTLRHEAIIAKSDEHCADRKEQEQAVSIANKIFAQSAALETISLKNVNTELDPEKPMIGYVSVGKANNYVNSNFRNLETGEKALKELEILKAGTVLKARWSVNLRTNDEDTESGKNPSKTIINDGECVRMNEDLPEPIRGSYWVNVVLIECKKAT